MASKQWVTVLWGEQVHRVSNCYYAEYVLITNTEKFLYKREI